MKITVRYFASIREAIGQGSEAVDTAAATLGELRDELIARGSAHAASIETLLMPGKVSQAHAKYESECSLCHDRADRAAGRRLEHPVH